MARFFEARFKEKSSRIEQVVQAALKKKILPAMERRIRAELTEEAEDGAIKLFSDNLRNLLMIPPLKGKVVLGFDPAFRTGAKLAVVDQTGKLIMTQVIYPVPPASQSKINQAKSELAELIKRYAIEIIAIGNGTASRESEAFVAEILKDFPQVSYVLVNESGASVYSASELARHEFPDLSVEKRSAISIARRLQDPLAELVKIDPKSIGVGQYQHDVNQTLLKEELDTTVMRCVNKVGVNLNTASKSLLSYVSGIGDKMAENIVAYRSANGAFNRREALKKVPRLGDKVYQQAVAFLRIKEGDNPLDNSAVHPEAYPIVHKMAKDLGLPTEKLIGNKQAIATIDIQKYITDEVGILYLKDVLKELEKPGLDPRQAAKSFAFDPNVKTFDDVRVGMVLPGIVNNITAFGCFVDIGLKESGLVHISQLKDGYVSDVNEVVKLHQQVEVKVTEVDEARHRISLSMIF